MGDQTVLVRLDTIAIEDGKMIYGNFPAIKEGRWIWVTAVLDRTAVYEEKPGEPKALANKRSFLVDPEVIKIGLIISIVEARAAAKKGRANSRKNRLKGEDLAKK